MNKHTTFSICSFVFSLTLSAAAAAAPSGAEGLRQSFAAACQGKGARCDASTPSTANDLSFERRVLSGDVVEYRVDVRVGPGPFDVIGLHRVVRETAPHQPARARQAVMMVHGDIWDFESAFLAAGTAPAYASLPVHLAENGIDVWGVDLGWTRVPAGTSDLSFMKDWGVDRDTHDIGVALGIARDVRATDGNGRAPLHLLGWSRGGLLAYAHAAAESQRPEGMRDVGGIIPVDIYLKTDVESRRLDACARYQQERALVEGGQYANEAGGLIGTLGGLAQLDPAGASPIFAGLDNEHAGMLVGAATFLLVDRAPVASYHLTAGVWDGGGALLDLAHTDRDAWFDITSRGRPYQPWALIAESDAAMCDDPEIADVAFDDHLEDVTVPVLYVGAGGGFGEAGVYTTTQLGSDDVTAHVVQRLPEADRLLDIGHTDIFHAADADVLFWEPIRAWIEAH
ncbi:alpha/beta hydrolase [Polyangium aurulentum]|uniref:alpha/beta hydrolase n=1 Tax=Polyangium aurulentum TaxID=2567896 RepID=UPI0010AED6A4|nr:hypothetical protein [Polyangium aurulentum]UQA58413.1 hypothetical protein E8A73_045410 [Polyangium aurulentum]